MRSKYSMPSCIKKANTPFYIGINFKMFRPHPGQKYVYDKLWEQYKYYGISKNDVMIYRFEKVKDPDLYKVDLLSLFPADWKLDTF